MAFELPEQKNPNEPVQTKFTADGVSVMTRALAAGYPLLRQCVEMLKHFDHEAFDEYSKIKGNGSVFGKKTPESRRAAYEFAFKRAGEIIINSYNADFTSGTEQDPGKEEGEEWKK